MSAEIINLCQVRGNPNLIIARVPEDKFQTPEMVIKALETLQKRFVRIAEEQGFSVFAPYQGRLNELADNMSRSATNVRLYRDNPAMEKYWLDHIKEKGGPKT
jgi:hypothetical protein